MNEIKTKLDKPKVRCSISPDGKIIKSPPSKRTTNYNINEQNQKKIAPEVKQMQQIFKQRYYENQVNNSNNNLHNQNQNKTQGEHGGHTNNPNNLGPLSQIAPIFNLLNGGKNPQIGNLINALGTGNMDMNKMLNAMMQNQSNIQSTKTKKDTKKPEPKIINTENSEIKNLKRI